jgi:hypothetical protein
MLRWDRYGFHKERTGKRYTKLMFLHPWDLWVKLCTPVSLRCETLTHYVLCLGGTIMDSTKGASGHVTPNLCFLHLVRSACHIVHSVASGV